MVMQVKYYEMCSGARKIEQRKMLAQLIYLTVVIKGVSVCQLEIFEIFEYKVSYNNNTSANRNTCKTSKKQRNDLIR